MAIRSNKVAFSTINHKVAFTAQEMTEQSHVPGSHVESSAKQPLRVLEIVESVQQAQCGCEIVQHAGAD